jgi:hypothetical protein
MALDCNPPDLCPWGIVSESHWNLALKCWRGGWHEATISFHNSCGGLSREFLENAGSEGMGIKMGKEVKDQEFWIWELVPGGPTQTPGQLQSAGLGGR